jgi:hypothetical protein
VLYDIPGMQSIEPREFAFTGADGELLPGRVYLPPAIDRGRHGQRDPAPGCVVIVEGYPDPGFMKHVGCRFMDMQWSISMAQLIAASGMAAITYANRQPAQDAVAIIDYLTTNASELGIDGSRIALWATSGHGPVAISLLHRASCAVLSNPMTDTAVSLPPSVPIFVIRSGKDETPGLNVSLDRFTALALAQNQAITLVNHAAAPHSFELYHDSSSTRHILRQALGFLGELLRIP